MFDLPDSKRVRRDAVYASSSDDEAAPALDAEQADALRAKLHARLAQDMDLAAAAPIPIPTSTAAEDARGGDKEAEPEEFEFRLFATGPAPKVVLAPEDAPAAAAAGGGLVVPHRRLSFHVPGPPGVEEATRFRAVAVSGEEVVARAARERGGDGGWPGRVTRVSATRAEMRVLRGALDGVGLGGLVLRAGGVAGGDSDEEEEGGEEERPKRVRPGKKVRVAMRVKEQLRKEKEAAEELMKVNKEEHVREKKKRLNREKKLKRRQKEREKKAATKGGGAGDQDGADSKDSTPEPSLDGGEATRLA